MRRKILGYGLLFVLAINCLLVSGTRRYEVGDIDDMITKRMFHRREFIKDFCKKRCNVGQGGLLCRCNGFHFAGKRTSIQQEDGVEPTDSEKAIYDLLSRNLKVSLGPAGFMDETNNAARTGLVEDIGNDWSMARDVGQEKQPRSPESFFERVVRAYMGSDDDYSI